MDVRIEGDYDAGHCEGAVNCPLYRFVQVRLHGSCLHHGPTCAPSGLRTEAVQPQAMHVVTRGLAALFSLACHNSP